MPQVPYSPVPDVSPQSPGESISVSTPPAAFGANIGAALEGLGQNLDKAGGEIFQRAVAIQQLRNETEAREADAKYAEAQGLAHAQYGSKEGKDAVDGLQPYIKQSRELRQQFRNSLSNDAARKEFDASSLAFLQRNIFNAAGHAAEQGKQYVINENSAAVKRNQFNYVDPSNEEEVAEKIRKGDQAVDTVADVKGVGPEQREEMRAETRSGTYEGQITALARVGKTQQAWQIFQDRSAEGLINQKDHDRIQDLIWSRNEAIGAKNLVDQVYSSDKSSEKMLQELKEKAEDPKVSLGDPKFGAVLESQLLHKINFEKREVTYERNTNQNVIYSRINSGDVSTLQELQNDPQAGPAYGALPEKEKTAWATRVTKAAAARDQGTELKSYQVLEGMARSDPARFASVDLFDPSLKLSKQDRAHFLQEQDRAIKQPIADRNVQAGIQFMRTNFAPEMKALGLVNDHGHVVQGEDYDQFVGGMSIALQEWKQEHNGKNPSATEFSEQIAKPLIRTHAEPSWFGLSHADVPEFKRTIPQEDIDKATQELTKAATGAGLTPPTENEIRRWIIRKQWDQFYRGSTSKPEEKAVGRPSPARPGSNIAD